VFSLNTACVRRTQRVSVEHSLCLTDTTCFPGNLCVAGTHVHVSGRRPAPAAYECGSRCLGSPGPPRRRPSHTNRPRKRCEDGGRMCANTAVPRANVAVPRANTAVPWTNVAVPWTNTAVPWTNVAVPPPSHGRTSPSHVRTPPSHGRTSPSHVRMSPSNGRTPPSRDGSYSAGTRQPPVGLISARRWLTFARAASSTGRVRAAWTPPRSADILPAGRAASCRPCFGGWKPPLEPPGRRRSEARYLDRNVISRITRKKANMPTMA
jgi:hypothetical protein